MKTSITENCGCYDQYVDRWARFKKAAKEAEHFGISL